MASGNTTNDSFSHATKMLGQVYADHRITFYCGAEYDAQGNITLPDVFETPKHEKRADKIEWEHALPAENFGQTFPEWREGSPECVDNRGKEFRGRKCAEKVSPEYRQMQDCYSRYHMSRQQEQLMGAWDKQYPVDKWECTRAKRIESLQGNENKFVKAPCQAAGLW